MHGDAQSGVQTRPVLHTHHRDTLQPMLKVGIDVSPQRFERLNHSLHSAIAGRVSRTRVDVADTQASQQVRKFSPNSVPLSLVT